ncbi:MAG: PBP1A family penicillin-binding protein [Lachnospiraceae bacterium]|nr:PBP1A family penicillin-binding protein [Lachnospiraceae bacterium]
MNYGRKNVTHKREKLKSSSAKVGKRAGVSTLRVMFFGLLTLLVVLICMGIGAFRGLIDSAPDISDVNIMPMGYATFVYDADGNEIQKLNSSDGNRISVSIDEIPVNMQHAIVAVEDSRFYEHNGIDPRGIARAVYVAIKNRGQNMEGASTITQQLLKNNVFTNWINEGTMGRFKRKFQEQYLAVKLEAALKAEGKDAKSVILENYLNTVNFGAGAYGVQIAAQTYFGKDSTNLTLSECAVLASIPQNPTKYNPKRHPEYNAERRSKVLKDMLEQSYITQEEYDTAMADDVYSRIIQDSDTSTVEPYSYFVDALISQLQQDLMTVKGYTVVQAKNAIYSGGLRIYTTQNSAIQQIIDEEYQNPENFPADSQIGLDWALTVIHPDGTLENFSREMLQEFYRTNLDPSFDLLFGTQEEAQGYIDDYKTHILLEGDTIQGERSSFTAEPQSSMVIMDQKTGYVKGLVGGRGEKTASLTLNRATGVYRQPGSTFKILSTYGPAIDTGAVNLATTVKDEPIQYINTNQTVKNSDGQYRGDITVRYAIEQSVNVVAVKTLTQITPQLGFNYLTKLGFDGLDANHDINQPLALGGVYNGVTTLQLAGAYAAIANQGTYMTPVLYTKVLDQDGNIVLDNEPSSKEIFSESTSYLLTSAMKDVISKGTGTLCQLGDMTVAGKTGTTTDARDLVFAGYTPYYTCAVWAGYDSNIPLAGEDQNFHKVLWQKVMSRIHENLPVIDFEQPSSVKQVTICSETGLLAGMGCPTATEYFKLDEVPTKRCTQHYVAPTPTPTKAPTITPAAPGDTSPTPTGGAATETPTDTPSETPPVETPEPTEPPSDPASGAE